MVRCPNCGTEVAEPTGNWTGGSKTRKPMKVQKFVCTSCGTTFVSWRDSKTGEVRAMARGKGLRSSA